MTDRPALTCPDAPIIREILGGNPQAFVHLVTKYERLVKSAVWNFFRDQGMVDDLAQEAFFKAFRHLASFQEEGRFKGWLMKLTVRLCIDVSRRQKVRGGDSLPLPEQAVSPASAPEAVVDRLTVRRLLDALPPTEGLIIWLKFVEDFSYREIAEILTDQSEANIRQRSSRAMKAMREGIS